MADPRSDIPIINNLTRPTFFSLTSLWYLSNKDKGREYWSTCTTVIVCVSCVSIYVYVYIDSSL